jgi:Holliday junction resolvasome RuvABC endonuclease subunit
VEICSPATTQEKSARNAKQKNLPKEEIKFWSISVSISQALKPKASRVMGIDASTKSIAFAVLEGDQLVRCGEIILVGSTVYERLVDARRKMEVLVNIFDVNFVAMEKAVMVRSAEVGLKMAMVFGAVLSVLLDRGAQVVEVYPIQWQSYIGNKNYTQKQKAQVKVDFPGKSATWYKAKIREQRKQFTLDWVEETYGVKLESDNVSDAFGLAYYAAQELVR